MKPKDVFKEFMTLEYTPGKRPAYKDIPIRTYMINRIGPSGWNIINLYNGTSIRIPWETIDIFYSLDVWGGHKILQCSEIEDRVDNTILNLSTLIFYSRDKSKRNQFLETLFKICKEGTGNFRKWFSNEFGKTLYPIEFNSLDNYKTI